MKERRKITFIELLVSWFCVALLLTLINGFFIKIPILHNVIMSTLGIALLIYPVYPIGLTAKFSEKKCKLFIRVLAVIEIILSYTTIFLF